MAAVKNMTTGSPGKLIFFFSLPLMLGNIFQQLYTVVDTMVVGQALGVNALAALGATDWLNWMSLGLIQGFTQGFSILMAQRFGAEDEEGLRKSVGNSLILSAVLAGALLVLMQLILNPMLNLLHVPDLIRPMAVQYLRLMFAGVPVVMAYNIFACILRSLGDSKTPLRAMIIAALTNVGLDLLFVVVLNFGIAGAAAATIIAQAVSAIYCIRKILQIPILHFQRSDFVLEGELVKRLWILGIPMAFQNLIISVGGMIVQSVVNGFGVVFMAGFAATNKLYGILEIAAISYGYAVVTYVGQNLGAGRMDRIKKGYRSSLIIAMFTSAVIAACMLLLGKHIVALFISGTPEQTVQAVALASRYLMIMSLGLPILYYLHITRSCIQGLGNTVLPMVSGLSEFAMRTLAAFLLPALFGHNGMLFAELMAWIGADVVLFFSYIYSIRRKSEQMEVVQRNAS